MSKKSARQSKNPNVSTQLLCDEVFDLDSCINSVLSAFEKDILSAYDSDLIPNSEGQISVIINKKENRFDLEIKSNGRGITTEVLESMMQNLGSSRTNSQRIPNDLWLIAPFYFSPNSYMLISNPRTEGDAFVAESNPSGFSIGTESSSLGSFGMKIKLEIQTDEYTVPEIGDTIREIAEKKIESTVVYELRENGTAKEQVFINCKS